ncbi:2946_t:CDS:2 [Ambispora gerdemannii]|uniref:2946_t:CDS:1 n=1 Tax=Ambispora gerdemannii TaxID=144530 RepID=A0A9N9CS22_9GLOM|nr:2946_t:CDS:2 [Ambispora gerdemannii]
MTRGRNNWTCEDDHKLKVLYKLYQGQPNLWRIISHWFPKQNSKTCRERWIFHTDPAINHLPFTYDERQYILSRVNQPGTTDWVVIADELSSPQARRTSLQCKNFVNNRQRRIEGEVKRLTDQYKKSGDRMSLGFILN